MTPEAFDTNQRPKTTDIVVVCFAVSKKKNLLAVSVFFFLQQFVHLSS